MFDTRESVHLSGHNPDAWRGPPPVLITGTFPHLRDIGTDTVVVARTSFHVRSISPATIGNRPSHSAIRSTRGHGTERLRQRREQRLQGPPNLQTGGLAPLIKGLLDAAEDLRDARLVHPVEAAEGCLSAAVRPRAVPTVAGGAGAAARLPAATSSVREDSDSDAQSQQSE